MSNRLGVFSATTAPNTGAGLVAAIGQLAFAKDTGLDWVKTGTADTAWTLASTAIGGGFHGAGFQAFTASGTYTPTAGMKYCLAIGTGPGGGGGGADTDGTANAVGTGSGGGAGETSMVLLTAAQIGASKTVTIGTGGTAGSDSGGDGSSGSSATSLGSLLVAQPGDGGLGSGINNTTSQRRAGSAGGSGGTGTLKVLGGSGGDGLAVSTYVYGGSGGVPIWGGGGRQIGIITSPGSTAGAAGRGYGAGGSGAVAIGGTTTGAAGGAGKDGVLYIIEFLGPA